MTDTLFIRLLHHEDKGGALAGRIAALREGRADGDIYTVNPDSFRQVPNTPFCYWVSDRIRRLFREFPPFESEGRTVKQGLATADDFRFVRAWWEVPADQILDGGRWSAAVGHSGEDGEEKWTEERIRKFQAWCRKRTYEGKRWVPFAKGGEYSPYYADIHLVVNWEKDGGEMKAFSGSVIRNPDYYFRPGLTWTYRTNVGFSVRCKPANTIHGHVGHSAFPDAAVATYLGWFNSLAVAHYLIRLLTTYKWEVGYVRHLPVPNLSNNTAPAFNRSTHAACLKWSIASTADFCHAFTLPAVLQVDGETLAERGDAWSARTNELRSEIVRIQAEIDEAAFDLYGFTEEERQPVVGGQRAVNGGQWSADSDKEQNGEVLDEEEISETSTIDHRSLTTDFLSWCVGVAFGRFDIRLALNPSLVPGAPDPFDPLPVCPPGMLVGPDGLPAKPGGIESEAWLRARPDANTLPPNGSLSKPTIPDSEYSLRINWDGILVDDPGHEDDIVRRVREVLEVIWPEDSRQRAVGSRQKKDGLGGDSARCIQPTAYSIERETCEILGVRELRDYFRKPGNAGFWMDHVKRYSKSRRKAPIYWYLRSAKGNYGLWLYYHRLDKDILFKALFNYVEPKIRLEEDRLNTLRARKEKVGRSGREAKQIEKEMDRQEQFVSELRDFKDKLRRVANLHLDFDLNDGVIMNIAPLWELIPWKEPQKYWEELQEGKYDWSHIAYQLWPERVEELCRKDRSIAIAHGREDLCEVEPAKSKRRSRR